jgi:hypothetical protein
MGYITSKSDPTLIKFIVTVWCMECKSDHCKLYIKEPDKDYGPSEDALIMPSRIIYRCLDCGNIVDEESG